MQLYISDANIFIDLEVCGILPKMFDLPYEFAVPDILCGKLVKRIVQGGNSIGGAISQDGSLIAVSNYEPGGVKIFSSDDLSLVADIPATKISGGKNSKTVGLVDVPGQRFVFSLYDSGEIWIVEMRDPKNPSIQRFEKIGVQPYDGLVTPDGRHYIAGLFGEDGMALLDLWKPQQGVQRIMNGYGRGKEKLPVYKMPHLEGWAMAGRYAFLPAVGQHEVLVVDSQTWKAHMHWADDLGATEGDLQSANQESVDFITSLRNEFSDNTKPIVLNGMVGPKGDAYAPDQLLSVGESRQYHAQQLTWLAKTEVDMVTALTFTQADEATGFVLAAKDVSLPCVVSFTVETDGNLPTGQSIAAAIEQVDNNSDSYSAYFMINCAHPDHFSHLLGDESWARRIKGIRCNASRLSHAELDECEVLDDGNPQELGEQYRWVQIFENNGEAMGASNPHPHGQIWAGSALPTLPEREDRAQRRYMDEHGSPLLLDYLEQDGTSERVVVNGAEWVALVPYWATWPFETIVIPKKPIRRITEVDGTTRSSLAAVLSELLTRYDNLFEHPFPYSMGWHGAPFGEDDDSHWQLHAHFYPPLLRSASVRKFMVGYELLAEAQRDLSPEDAAARLRELSTVHYTERSSG